MELVYLLGGVRLGNDGRSLLGCVELVYPFLRWCFKKGIFFFPSFPVDLNGSGVDSWWVLRCASCEPKVFALPGEETCLPSAICMDCKSSMTVLRMFPRFLRGDDQAESERLVNRRACGPEDRRA